MGDAVLTACHLIKRITSFFLDGSTPHATLFPMDPPFPVPPHKFGCFCFVHQLTPGTDKLDSYAVKCVFLGYSGNQKGYSWYSPVLRRFFVFVDVTFFETTFYYSKSHTIIDPDFMLPVPRSVPPESTVSPVLSTSSISSRLDCPNLQTYSHHCHNVDTISEPTTLPIASEFSNSYCSPER